MEEKGEEEGKCDRGTGSVFRLAPKGEELVTEENGEVCRVLIACAGCVAAARGASTIVLVSESNEKEDSDRKECRRRRV